MNQIIMILLVSLLVLVHEVGHFVAAKLCGVRVTRFGIGMPIGPSWKLFSWNKTDFYLHAFLFGGYVGFPDDEPSLNRADESQARTTKPEVCKHACGSDELAQSAKPYQSDVEVFKENFTGAEPSLNKGDETNEDNKTEGIKINDNEVLPKDSPELYENKTISQKLFIVSAGVIMNVVFAIFLVIFCAAYYHKLPTSNQNVYVDSFSSKITSNVEAKGIQKDDRIAKVNGYDINHLYQLTFFAKNSKVFDDYADPELIEKNIAELKKLNPKLSDTIAPDTVIKLPMTHSEEPLKVNKNVLSGLEKYKKQGVQLTKAQIDLRDEVYGQKTYKTTSELSLNDLASALSDTYKPLTITIERNNKEYTYNDIKVSQEGILGIILKIQDLYTPTNTPREIVVKSCDYLYSTTATMLFSLWQLFSGKVNASDMHGVIAVVKVGGDIIASKGMLNGILLTAMISINLAIMNFLPIPALDGGHVAFLIFEKVTGKKPTPELSEKINNFFFALLIALMVAICYNDIFALVTKKF